MTDKLKKLWPYAIAIILAFYLLPLAITDTGSAMMIMLIGIPAVCLISSVLFGIKGGFWWPFGLIVAVLFIPTIFLFYNATAWFYTLVYAAVALAGDFAGMALKRAAS